MKNACIVLIGLLVSVLALNAGDQPNVLILLVDDMGYGDTGCYNPESRIPTPHIDRLAREGMRFTDAHSAGSLCHPSRYGLMTGEYPFRTDVSPWRKRPLIAKEQMTIASLFKAQGYRTAMVGKWHLGFRENGYENPLPGGPVDRGFESYFGMRASTDIPPYFYVQGDKAVDPPSDHIAANKSKGWSPIQGAFWRAGGIAPGMQLKDVLPRFADETIKVIHAQQESNKKNKKPFFLYCAFTGPHTPWLPSPEFVGKSGAGMYGDFMMMIDAEIGRILEALDAKGFSEDTLVIFSSDNGPTWYDADRHKYGHDSAGGFRGMKGDAWEAGHRVPFVVRWPGVVKAGAVSEQMINFTDLLATFADICEADLPDDAGPDSFSFLPALKGELLDDNESRSSMVMRGGVSSHFVIRSADWKLIKGLGSGGFSKPRVIKPEPGQPAVQLYNLGTDPGETTNLAAEQPERVDALLSTLQTIIDDGRSR